MSLRSSHWARRFVLLVFLFLGLFMASEGETREIYVRLASEGNCTVTSGKNIRLSDAKKKTLDLGKKALLRIEGGRVTVGKQVFTTPVCLTSSSLLGFKGRTYRGKFLITRKTGLLNVLDIQDYLKGVLPSEVGVNWPMEALRAQAIISRTYALRQSMGRAARGYDVQDTVADQVYKGAGVEKPRTNQAVQSTPNEILVYGRDLAFTPFHSDSGGHTANNEDVWGKALPYLVGVPEPEFYASPNASWSVTLSESQVAKALSRITGTSIGAIRSVKVADVDSGGRARNLTFVGTRGSKTVRAGRFRMAVGANVLKSTMLTPTAGSSRPVPARSGAPAAPRPLPNPSLPPKPELSAPVPQKRPFSPRPILPGGMSYEDGERLAKLIAEGAFKASELMDMLKHPEKKNDYLILALRRTGKSDVSKPEPGVNSSEAEKIIRSQSRQGGSPALSGLSSSRQPGAGSGFSLLKKPFVIQKSGSAFVFYGRGWGHGVGLSQWGSRTLAQKGWKAENILTHYYPGTEVKRYQ